MRPEFEAWILDQIERQRRGEQISEYLSPTFLKSLSRLVEHNVFGGEMNTIDRAAQDLETTASRIREECRRLTLLAEQCEKEAKDIRKVALRVLKEAELI